jgi:signal peptidase I
LDALTHRTEGSNNRALPNWVRRALIGRNPKRTLARIVVLVVVCSVLFKFVLMPVRVEGPSMLPTYKDHRVNFANRLAYLFHEPRRGDIVAIRTTGPHNMYMKRIIGLPGETVAFHRGHAVINGLILDEPYLKYPCDWEVAPRTLGPKDYYVVGDNRSMAERDHEKGIANRNRIIGKILL